MVEWAESDQDDEGQDEESSADRVIDEFDEFVEKQGCGLAVHEQSYLHSVLRHVTNDFPFMEGNLLIKHETINDRVMRLQMDVVSRPRDASSRRDYLRAVAEEKLVLMMQYPLCVKPDALDDLGIALLDAGMDVNEDQVIVYYGMLEEFFELHGLTTQYITMMKSIKRALCDGDTADADNLKENLLDNILGYARAEHGIPLEKDEQIREQLCKAKDRALEFVLTCAMDALPQQRDMYLERATKILAYDVTHSFREQDEADVIDYSWAKNFAESLKNAKI